MSDADERDLDEEQEEEEVDAGEQQAQQKAVKPQQPPPEPEEVLPDEKPWSGTVECDLPVAVGITSIVVRFPSGDHGLPQWLQYLCNDDEFWFKRCAAGITAGHKSSHAAAASSEAAQGDDEDGEGGAEGDAPVANTGDAGGTDEEIPFDPAAQFVLVQSLSDGPAFFNITAYKPPVELDDEAAAAAAAAEGAGDAAGEGEAEEVDEAAEAAAAEAAAAAAALAQAEAAEAPIEIIVDAVVLAVLFARTSCLPVVLAHPKVSLGPVATIVSASFAAGHRQVLDGVIEATMRLPPASRRRRTFDFAWLVNLCNHTDAAVAQSAASYLQKLLAADVVPAAPIPATALGTTLAVTAYLDLLFRMPKSLLTKWSKPVAVAGEEEAPADDDGADPMVASNAPVPRFLLAVLIDLRRREVRRAKGKAPLRESCLVAHKATIATLTALGGGDKGVDTIAAPQFAAGRPYYPTSLQLRMSDLLTVALARHAESIESFKAVFALRLKQRRDRAAPFGLPTLLFESFARGMCTEAIDVVVQQGDLRWFAPNGAIDVDRWARQGLSANPAAFNSSAAHFAKRWCRRFLDSEHLLAMTEDSCIALYDKLREVERFTDLFLQQVKRADGAINPDTVALSLTRCGPEALCNGKMLYAAMQSRNTEAILWLLNRDVATVELPTGSQSVPVLEYAATHLRDADLTLFLVHCGADLHAPWCNGTTTGTCAVQDLFDEAVAKEILAVHARKEAERINDPRCKVGLLHASAA